MRKHYEDFIKLPIEKMAKAIMDMTYAYKNTVVPEKHYKDILNKETMEIIANDVNIQTNLLKPYYDMMATLKKENPTYFYKAMLLVETNTKLSTINSPQIHALDVTVETIRDSKMKHILNEEIVNCFNDMSKNGVPHIDLEYVEDESLN